MHLTVLTQPAPLVTTDEAKLALGESGSDKDDLIGGLILAAQAELDGPTGWVGITVAEQTIEARLDAFCQRIGLPYGPVIAVGSVKYLDEDEVEQTVDGATYTLLADGSIVPAADEQWPSASSQPEAVRVVYSAGIDDSGDPRIALMKAAITMHVKMTLDMEDVETRRKAIVSLTRPLRVWGKA